MRVPIDRLASPGVLAFMRGNAQAVIEASLAGVPERSLARLHRSLAIAGMLYARLDASEQATVERIAESWYKDFRFRSCASPSGELH